MLGLALEGGGAKGAYEIGAYRALTELGYHFDVICGVSIGAINAALLAQGDKRLTREEIAINSIRLEVPVDTSVRAELWNGSGYRGF